MTMSMIIRSRCWITCCLSVLLFLLVQLKTVAQESTLAGANDTLRFLKAMMLKKDAFVGQPFSKLEAHFNQINKKTQFFSPSSLGSGQGKGIESSTVFYFNIPVEFDDFGFPHFRVYWQTPFPRVLSRVIYKKWQYLPNGINWTTEARQYYKDKIIKDIDIDYDDEYDNPQ